MSHRRFHIEAVLAAVSAGLAVLTALLPDWIEAATGLHPDAGSGALEWVIAGAFGAVALGVGTAAGREWRRLRLAV